MIILANEYIESLNVDSDKYCFVNEILTLKKKKQQQHSHRMSLSAARLQQSVEISLHITVDRKL